MKLTIDAQSKRHIDENGFLHVSASNISKEAVNPYYGYEIPDFAALGLEPTTVYNVYREGAALAEGAKTFVNLPLLRGHYEDSAERPQKEHRVGSIGSDVTFTAPYLTCSLCVTDGEAIRKIQSGERVELSAAYQYEPVLQRGEFEGKPYDIIMKNIRGNHVALVDEGRAGADVVVADAKPQTLRGKSMSLKKARMAMDEAIKALKLAKDEGGEESQAIEQAESDVAKAALAIQRIEAESEGDNPEDFDINEDAMDAMKKCGLDAESPSVKKAWAEGVKYGEKLEKKEPEKLDREHESEGAKKAMDTEDKATDAEPTPTPSAAPQEGTTKAAMDAAIKQSESRVVARLRDQQKAADMVAPLIGKVDAMAFDSADAIYLKAAELSGAEATLSTAQHVCMALVKHQRNGLYAQDAAISTAEPSRFAAKKGA